MGKHHSLEYLSAVACGQPNGVTPAFVARHFGVDAHEALRLLRKLVARGDLVERMEDHASVFHAKPKGPAHA